MRLIILCFFCLLFSLNASAQFVSIPDTNFRNWLNLNGFSSCMNGNLIDTTCSEILSADTVNILPGTGINNLDGIQYFDNLFRLTVSSSQSTPLNKRLDTIPALPYSLNYISIYRHTLSTLPPLPDSLEYLYCHSGTIQSLPALPNTLKMIMCSSNELTSLPSLPDSLRTLICYSNNLTSLPAMPDSIQEIRCGKNPIAVWPVLPNSLESLWIEGYSTVAMPFPVLPDSLDDFICTSLDWTSLPNLPPGLKYLRCSGNLLTTIAPLPASLSTLMCSFNLLNELPVLPDSLKELGFGFNPITTFPALPSGLFSLSCDSINLVNFPAPFPQTLVYLSCSNNPLVSLPNFPSQFWDLHCENTMVSQIPPLNSDMYSVYISNNPLLTCFPVYQNIDYLRWTNTPISCLPNAGFIGNSTPSISGLPLCVSSSSCLFNWSMYGKIYNDTNYNCSVDITENLFRNLRVNLKWGGNIMQSMIFNTEGYYSFKTLPGNYEVELDTVGIPFDVNCPIIGKYFSNITAIDSTDENLDFGLNCKSGFYDLEAKSISPNSLLIPGDTLLLRLKAGDASLFYGVSCASGISGIVQTTLTGLVTYIAPAPNALTPSSVNFNTITWNINDFSQVNPYTDFDIIMSVDTTATIHDTLCVTLSISPFSDSYPLNNFRSQCFPVSSSFDPNAKEVFPSGNIDTTVQWLTYSIYFQNTGNFPASHIHILDTIDIDLDRNSFQYLSSSHDPIIQIFPSNVIRFNFPNINLPDSVNDEPNSHGYMQYRIKTKPGLPTGTTINNSAAIYFDYNTPVITNTVQNVVSSTVSLQESTEREYNIFPNPATNSFTVITSSEYAQSVTITLSDYTGKIIFKDAFVETGIITINSTNFKNGVYHLTIEGKDFVQIEKVVILK